MFRKRQLAIIILFMLTFGSLTSPPKVGEKQEVSQVPPSFFPSPVKGSEEETIDSFDVSPVNRWTIVNSGVTESVSNSLLNMSDVGDGTTDVVYMDRDLASLDDKVVILFKIKSDGSTTSANNRMILYIHADSGAHVSLYLNEIVDNDYAVTTLRYDGNNKVMTGTERAFEDIWYRLTFELDLLKSQLSTELRFHGNGSRVWKYRYDEVSSSRSSLFKEEQVHVRLYMAAYTSGQYTEVLIDYVDAPFKGHEWTQTDIPADADYLFDSWDAGRAQDDIDDTSAWRLTVPYLDSISALMSIDYSGTAVSGDDFSIYFRVYAVDADDGGLHEAVEIRLWMMHSNPPSVVMGSYFQAYMDTTAQVIGIGANTVGSDQPGIAFNIKTSQDRSRIELKMRAQPDITDTSTTHDATGEVLISSVATDPSQEFVLEVAYDMDFTGNIDVNSMLEDFSFQERDFITDLIVGVVGFFEGIWLGFVDMLLIGWRWLGSIFKVVGDVIVAGIGVFFLILEAAIDGLATLLTTVAGWLSDIFDVLADLAVAFGDYLLTLIGGFIDGAITFLLTIVSDLIDLGADIIFAIWDGLGLPNVLLWLDAITQVTSDGLGVLLSVITFLIAILTIAAGLLFIVHFFIPLMIGDSQGGYWEAWFSVAGFDVTFDLPLLPRVPLILPSFLIWVGVLAGTPYIGFF